MDYVMTNSRETSRETRWAALDQAWDVIVVGGGITGAGILREATRAGLRALLVERQDFAWGTSSRSSKLVHGGLRYLAQGHLQLTRESVAERERLLREGPGLITPLGFLFAMYRGEWAKRMLYQAGLAVYDLLGRRWEHQHLSSSAFQLLAPHSKTANLRGGLRYVDAQTDDARLVLRVIREAERAGATALNYVAATGLIREDGEVVGVRLRDQVGQREVAVRARVVINATGVWVDTLRREVDAAARMRPLRGSHLVFAGWRFPVAQGISFVHPDDGRPVFVVPWEGATIVGTTDLDHSAALEAEPTISLDELHYLMAAVSSQFPALGLSLDDIVSTWSGVRPVVGSGETDPSKELRDHVVWEEHGLLTVTGGKLTTFRLIALDALRTIAPRLPTMRPLAANAPVLDAPPADLDAPLDPAPRQRLLGRYGAEAAALVASAPPEELQPIPGTPTLWAELRWAARHEAVVQLADLLLRRVRIGLLLPNGGAAVLPAIRRICQPELGWDDARWEQEAAGYHQLVAQHYGVPVAKDIVISG
jgi:glycerol-3-phosphate dehydrogenase